MDYIARARTVIELEITELQRLAGRIGQPFADAVELLRAAVDAKHKLIICGVGKSGNVAAKLAATFNSTGAPAVVLSALDALHGDLGVVDDGDAVILLSQSGETDELLRLLPHLKREQIRLVAVTGDPVSTLARNADAVLDVHVRREACPLGLAPTSSSMVMMAMGDALAMVLLEARGFRAEDFAKLHPGGSLGRALLTKVGDIMRTGDRLALVADTATVMEAVHAMSRARSGCAMITQSDGTLAGILTQGDFTRAFEANPASVAGLPVTQFMTRRPVSIGPDRLAAELLSLLERHPVDEMVVIDDAGRPAGVVDTQDLSRHRLV